MERFLLNKVLLIDRNLRCWRPCDPPGAYFTIFIGVQLHVESFFNAV